MRRRDSGYTRIELLIALALAASIASSVGLIWAAVHFIRKFW